MTPLMDEFAAKEQVACVRFDLCLSIVGLV